MNEDRNKDQLADDGSTKELQQALSSQSEQVANGDFPPATQQQRKFIGKRKKRTRKKSRKPIVIEHKEGEHSISFAQISKSPLTDEETVKEVDAPSVGRSSDSSKQEAEYDEYGVLKDNHDSQLRNDKGYNGGIKRS